MAGVFSQNLGFPFNIYTLAEAREGKFGTQLKFANAIIKSHPEEKCRYPIGREAPENSGVPL